MTADKGSQVYQAFHTCMQQALQAYERNEVPVGACIIHNGKIIALAGNRVVEQQNATAHAEMLCIKEASAIIGPERLSEADLYSTLEPCLMCTGAALQSRLRSVNFLEYDERQSAFSFIMQTAKVHRKPSFSRYQIQDFAYHQLLLKFFQEKR